MSPLKILERTFRPYVQPSKGGERVGDVVYLLVRDRQVVYVGVTRQLPSRILSHATEMRRLERGVIPAGKRFDRALFMVLPRRYLRLFEQALIRELRPEYNKRIDNPMPDENAALYWLGLRSNLTTDDIAWQEVA
jgi:hypothetical protein